MPTIAAARVPHGSALSGSSGGWQQWTIDLTQYRGQKIDLALVYAGRSGDRHVEERPSLLVVAQLADLEPGEHREEVLEYLQLKAGE